jgi:putative endopeptidase
MTSIRTRVLGAAAVATLAACGASSKSTPAPTADTGGGQVSTPGGPAPDAEAVQVTLADVGLEAASLDRNANACEDFYQFACGGWLAANPIPADKARWGRFSEVGENNEKALHEILEDARSGKSTDAAMTKLGAYYGSCMDEKAVEKAGLSGIKPLLDAAAKVKDAKSLDAAIVLFHRSAVYPVFNWASFGDFADSKTNALYLDTGGLGLPDRDYYVKDEFKDKVTAYREHLVRLFGLLGKNKAAATRAADDVLAVETELAKVTKTGVERRDLPKLYNPTDLAGLAAQSPGFPWQSYFTQLGHPGLPKIVVTTPDHVKAFATLRTSLKPAQWQAYLTARVVDDTANALPKKFDQEAFALAKALTGVEQQRDRWKRCVDATSLAMPELLGQPYVARKFPGASKTAATDMVKAIAKAMGEQIAVLDWMSDKTKAAAKDKLVRLEAMIGYPDTWKTYDFEVSPANFAKNVLAAQAFEAKRQLLKAGKPVDRTEWGMPAFIVNAYYDPTNNLTALPAGILQPPFFGAERSIAANLGGIGMVVGHELTHGFDDQGSQFDAVGNMKNWWQPADLTKFQERGTCVAEQYSTFEALPGKKVNGQLTLGENIADLGGVKMAFQAYRSLRNGADKTYVADGFSEDQQFFIAVAQAWCSQDRPDEIQRRLTADVHAPPKFRVYGALRNLPVFAEAFSCAEGTPMNPTNACHVW